MSEETAEKENTGKKQPMSQQRKLFLFTVLIVLSIVVLIVVLMETTDLGTDLSDGTPTTSDTSASTDDPSTSLGDAQSTSQEPAERTETFSQADISSGSLLYIDKQTGSVDNSFHNQQVYLYDNEWRMDENGKELYHMVGSTQSTIHRGAAEALREMMKVYRATENSVALEVVRAFDQFSQDDYSTTLALCLKVRDALAISYHLTDSRFATQTAWLFENMHKFGFIYVPEEKANEGHLRYVGVPHATYMYQNNMGLRAYLEMVSAYSYTQPLSIQVGDTAYAVYYIPAQGTGNFSGTVPNRPHTVSGDNLGGIVVAYAK